MKAYKSITMTNVDGILKDVNDPRTKISYISKKDARKLIENGTISGGMVPKIKECIWALENGVRRVHILNGFDRNSLLIEVFTNKGNGTMLLDEKEVETYLRSGF
jgi:acetylglutamate kinase